MTRSQTENFTSDRLGGGSYTSPLQNFDGSFTRGLNIVVNTYNAVAMYDIIKSNFPPDLDKVKVTFFYKNRFEIGGRSRQHLDPQIAHFVSGSLPPPDATRWALWKPRVRFRVVV